ncbi:MAG TPA: TVP38/TMEM64 family protein [Steroidobacteraceae bacterium]|nr:TVP38/TMEM64 family protein [Steroidobacteraceae bacterium]
MRLDRRTLISVGIPIGLLALLGAAYLWWTPFGDFVDKAIRLVRAEDREQLSQWIKSYGAWGPVVILGLMLGQTIVPVLPSLVPMIVAVVIYGAWWGGLLAWGGLLIAAILGYAIGRLLGPVTVDRLVGHRTREKIDSAVDRYGLWTIVAARISPVLSTDAVSLTAGLVCMRFVRFLLATAVGILPLVIAVAWLGEDFDRLGSGLIWISVVSVGALIAYVIWDRKAHPSSDESERGQTAS